MSETTSGHIDQHPVCCRRLVERRSLRKKSPAERQPFTSLCRRDQYSGSIGRGV